jgi:DNA-binding NarL/FixJ family response regulator
VCAQVRLAIENLPDLVVVGEAPKNYVGALAIAEIECPDLIVVDAVGDDDCAVDHIPDLVGAAGNVLVISDDCDEAMWERVRRMGAMDLVPREQVVPAVTRRLVCVGPGLAPLTGQEQAVIDLVGKGLNSEEIAGQLNDERGRCFR